MQDYDEFVESYVDDDSGGRDLPKLCKKLDNVVYRVSSEFLLMRVL